MSKIRFPRLMTKLIHEIGSIENMADDLNVYENVIEEWRNGKRLPTLDQLSRLKAYLGEKDVQLSEMEENTLYEVQQRVESPSHYFDILDMVENVAQYEARKELQQHEMNQKQHAARPSLAICKVRYKFRRAQKGLNT